ncbi:hypothetical protein SmphiM6_55 [Sinorhizobium phage phiM6]|nr:hypothetical protein SmphiM6_55 [Sinorhizobium phage phiM6]
MLFTYFLIALFIGAVSQVLVSALGGKPSLIHFLIDGILWPLTLWGIISMFRGKGK